MKTKIALAIAVGLLAGCSPDKPPPQAVYQPPVAAPVQSVPPVAAPVVVQQAAAPAPAHSGMQDMLVGGAIGALATHALTNRSTPAAPAPAPVTNTRIIERTVIVRQAPRPALTAPTPRPRISYTAPPRKVSLTKRK